MPHLVGGRDALVGVDSVAPRDRAGEQHAPVLVEAIGAGGDTRPGELANAQDQAGGGIGGIDSGAVVQVEGFVVALAESFLHGQVILVPEAVGPERADGMIDTSEVEADTGGGIGALEDGELGRHGFALRLLETEERRE